MLNNVKKEVMYINKIIYHFVLLNNVINMVYISNLILVLFIVNIILINKQINVQLVVNCIIHKIKIIYVFNNVMFNLLNLFKQININVKIIVKKHK